ncbi:MAG: hypothetical protein ACLRZH_08710 [Ruthenibacterium lactatiformans]
MEQEKKTAGMPCLPCKSAPFSRTVKPAAQENAVQEAAAPLGAPCQYGGSAVGRTEKTPGFTGVDAAFACGFLAVGWLFWELQLWSGWRWFGNAGTGTALFTALFAGAVLAYVYLASCARPGKLVLAGGTAAWGLAMHCPTAADCWEPSITRAAVHSGILDAERHGPSVEKWKDL